MREAEFTSTVRNQIAQEAMYVCSSPTCLRFTGYATSEGKPRAIAQAAHINAAGKKGPRANQAPVEDLKLSTNGVWLCSTCHDRVDDDPAYYTESMLRAWKEQHGAIIRRIVGRDLESALLDLRNHKRYHEEARDLLSFLENKRVLYEGLDHEFPPRVLDSLEMIRHRLIQTRARVDPGSGLFKALNQLQAAIDTFLRDIGKDMDLRTLRCDGNDPRWLQFSSELLALRKGMVIIMKGLADSAGYTLTWV